MGGTVRLLPGHDESGPHYTVPSGPGDGVEVPVALALHARIRPLGAAERILRAAVDGGLTAGIPDDPESMPPKRVRAGAVIVRDGRILLIRLENAEGEVRYEIPGGGVEDGEDLAAALSREIEEETGMTGRALRPLATVYRTSRRLEGLFLDHYFLAEAEGEFGALETLDLEPGARPVWEPVEALPSLPLWPRRLRWRIAHWHAAGWPAEAIVIADRNEDLELPCAW